MAMDEIRITDLEIFGHHGVYTEENTLGQKFLLSATLYTDTRAAGKTDDLSLSVNYAEVCHRIKTLAEKEQYKLLETVAERVCEDLLLAYPILTGVELEIKKPWAPIGLPLENVSVKIRRMWHRIYLGMGSNMGDRRAYLEGAVEAIKACPMIKDVKVSSIIETKPYGLEEQDDFLNGCISGLTLFDPEELLDFVAEIENANGRKRTIHWGPRTLDLDILYYDREIISTDRLCVPHPEIPLRTFVLQPMMELAPYFRDPVTDLTIAQMYHVHQMREAKEEQNGSI